MKSFIMGIFSGFLIFIFILSFMDASYNDNITVKRMTFDTELSPDIRLLIRESLNDGRLSKLEAVHIEYEYNKYLCNKVWSEAQ